MLYAPGSVLHQDTFSKIVLGLNTLASLITGGLFHSLIQVAFNLHWVFIISSCGSFSYMTPAGSPSPYDLVEVWPVEICSITMSPSQNTPKEPVASGAHWSSLSSAHRHTAKTHNPSKHDIRNHTMQARTSQIVLNA